MKITKTEIFNTNLGDKQTNQHGVLWDRARHIVIILKVYIITYIKDMHCYENEILYKL